MELVKVGMKKGGGTHGLGTYYTDVVFVRLVCVDSYIWVKMIQV